MKYYFLFFILILTSCKINKPKENIPKEKDSVDLTEFSKNTTLLREFDSLKINLDAHESNNVPTLLR